MNAVCICLMYVMVASKNNKLILGGKLYHTVKVSFELFKVSLRTYQSKKDAWGNSKIKWGKRWGNGYSGENLENHAANISCNFLCLSDHKSHYFLHGQIV